MVQSKIDAGDRTRVAYISVSESNNSMTPSLLTQNPRNCALLFRDSKGVENDLLYALWPLHDGQAESIMRV